MCYSKLLFGSYIIFQRIYCDVVLKCILRFWIHGRYSSSSSYTNNSNGTTTGKDEKKNWVKATKQMDRKEKESIAKGDENTKREKNTRHIIR